MTEDEKELEGYGNGSHAGRADETNEDSKSNEEENERLMQHWRLRANWERSLQEIVTLERLEPDKVLRALVKLYVSLTRLIRPKLKRLPPLPAARTAMKYGSRSVTCTIELPSR